MSAPRTWTLPPEPGPEVTAVRDMDGDLWSRRSDGDWAHSSSNGRGRSSWPDVMGYAPLTDASEVPS